MTHDTQPRTAGHRGHDLRALPRNGGDAIPPGAHLVTPRRGFLHHGIYAGSGRVIHYAGLSRTWRRGPIEDVALERFARGRPIAVKPADDAPYSGADVVARARSRLGEDRYRIASNNCEHFCEWCLRGTARSAQVERVLGWRPLAALRRFMALATPKAHAGGSGTECAA